VNDGTGIWRRPRQYISFLNFLTAIKTLFLHLTLVLLCPQEVQRTQMFIGFSKVGSTRESSKFMTFNTDIEPKTSFRVVGTVKLEKTIFGIIGFRSRRHIAGVSKEDLTNSRVKIGQGRGEIDIRGKGRGKGEILLVRYGRLNLRQKLEVRWSGGTIRMM